MLKIITAFAAAVALAACAGTDSTVDQTTGDGIEGLKKSCGGIADIQCPKGYQCVIKATYPDAMGTCKKKKACVQNVMCTLTSHWDSKACACVPNTCIDNVMCTSTSHWDSTLCECVENVTCAVLECMSGYHCEQTSSTANASCVKN